MDTISKLVDIYAQHTAKQLDEFIRDNLVEGLKAIGVEVFIEEQREWQDNETRYVLHCHRWEHSELNECDFVTIIPNLIKETKK